MNGYKSNEQLLRQQNSTKVHEAQLLDARRQRKETDDQLQAMMNRIAHLAQEELRLDRDIEAARRRAAEALARQATKDSEIAATAKEVLAVMPAAVPAKLRPHTGRSSLLASLSDGASASSAASPSSLRGSMASQLSSRSLESASQASGAASGAASPGAQGSGMGAAGSSGSGSSSGGVPGHPPRAPSASRVRPGVLTGRTADKANKLPPVGPTAGAATLRAPSPGARPGTASRPGTAGSRSRASSGSPPGSATPSSRRPSSDSPPVSSSSAAAAAAQQLRPTHGSAGSSSAADFPASLHAVCSPQGGGMQQLSGPGSGQGGGGDLHGDLPAVGGALAASSSGRNAMTVIHAAHAAELDGEVIEELQGSRAAGGGGGGGGSGGPSGLQEFATESGRKVVQVKASRRGEGTTVSAAGVGWGMGSRGGAVAAMAPKEARQNQAELAKKQQIWKVRKTFGLEPTPMSDRSAQVEEVGAGAWQ